jgi:hypothetical protein
MRGLIFGLFPLVLVACGAAAPTDAPEFPDGFESISFVSRESCEKVLTLNLASGNTEYYRLRFSRALTESGDAFIACDVSHRTNSGSGFVISTPSRPEPCRASQPLSGGSLGAFSDWSFDGYDITYNYPGDPANDGRVFTFDPSECR